MHKESLEKYNAELDTAEYFIKNGIPFICMPTLSAVDMKAIEAVRASRLRHIEERDK